MPGDKIWAKVSLLPDENTTSCANKLCLFNLTIMDINRNEIFSKIINYTSSLSVGEVIEEAQQIGSNESSSFPEPLINFGVANFGEDYTGINGTNFVNMNNKEVPLGDKNNRIIRLYLLPSFTNPLLAAIPSPLTTDNTSFKVYSDILYPLYLPNPIPYFSVINRGQSTALNDSGATGGTGDYAYKWLESYAASGSKTFVPQNVSCLSTPNATDTIFNTDNCAAPGLYRFRLKVTDNATLENFTSDNVSIYVNPTLFSNESAFINFI